MGWFRDFFGIKPKGIPEQTGKTIEEMEEMEEIQSTEEAIQERIVIHNEDIFKHNFEFIPYVEGTKKIIFMAWPKRKEDPEGSNYLTAVQVQGDIHEAINVLEKQVQKVIDANKEILKEEPGKIWNKYLTQSELNFASPKYVKGFAPKFLPTDEFKNAFGTPNIRVPINAIKREEPYMPAKQDLAEMQERLEPKQKTEKEQFTENLQKGIKVEEQPQKAEKHILSKDTLDSIFGTSSFNQKEDSGELNISEYGKDIIDMGKDLENADYITTAQENEKYIAIMFLVEKIKGTGTFSPEQAKQLLGAIQSTEEIDEIMEQVKEIQEKKGTMGYAFDTYFDYSNAIKKYRNDPIQPGSNIRVEKRDLQIKLTNKLKYEWMGKVLQDKGKAFFLNREYQIKQYNLCAKDLGLPEFINEDFPSQKEQEQIGNE